MSSLSHTSSNCVISPTVTPTRLCSTGRRCLCAAFRPWRANASAKHLVGSFAAYTARFFCVAPRGIHPSGGSIRPVSGFLSHSTGSPLFSRCHACSQLPTPGTTSAPERKSRFIASQPPMSVFLSFSQYFM